LVASNLLALVVFAFVTSALSLGAKKRKPTRRKSPLVFSPSGGVYATNVSLKISARASSPAIHYTLDGSEPDESSPAYSAPLLISNTTLVRAKAFAKESQASSIAAEVYTLLDDDLVNFSSNLPLAIVNSFGTNIMHEHKVDGGCSS